MSIKEILEDFETQVMIAMGGGEIDIPLEDHDELISHTTGLILDSIDHKDMAQAIVIGQNIHTPSEAYDEELVRDTAIAVNNYLVGLATKEEENE